MEEEMRGKEKKEKDIEEERRKGEIEKVDRKTVEGRKKRERRNRNV